MPAGADGAIQSTESIIGPYALQDFNLYYTLRYGFAPSKIAYLAEHAWDDVAAGAPVTLVSDAIYDHAEAVNGPGAAGALREWAGAGGVATVRRLDLRAGPVEADSTSGTLAIDPDGRLKGALVSRLKAPRALLTAIGARCWTRTRGTASPR